MYFIGGGPGDPELLTLKAKRIIESADTILYADSLVHPSICQFAKRGAEICGTSTLSLGEIAAITIRAARRGETVARIQSGDPAIYGAILEQMRVLEAEGIDYEVVPGICSAFAAAALLRTELTVPEMVQTVIFTRATGRTTMPKKEVLRDLASHGATMVLFLSISRISMVVREITAGGYPTETPVAVVYRVGWPDERVIMGTLGDIADKVKRAKISLHALIMVGKAFDPALRKPNAAETIPTSRLYAPEYTHRCRRARTSVRPTDDRAAQRTNKGKTARKASSSAK